MSDERRDYLLIYGNQRIAICFLFIFWHLSSMLALCRDLQVCYKISLINMPSTDLRVETWALFLHKPAYKIPLLEFPLGAPQHTPLRMLKELQQSFSWIPWTWTIQIVLCYIHTKGSEHSLCSDSQPVICKFFVIFTISCVTTIKLSGVLEEEIKIWYPLNSGATDTVRKWNFQLCSIPSSSSVLSLPELHWACTGFVNPNHALNVCSWEVIWLKIQDDIIENLLWTRYCCKHLQFMVLNSPLSTCNYKTGVPQAPSCVSLVLVTLTHIS